MHPRDAMALSVKEHLVDVKCIADAQQRSIEFDRAFEIMVGIIDGAVENQIGTKYYYEEKETKQVIA